MLNSLFDIIKILKENVLIKAIAIEKYQEHLEKS